MLPEFFDRFEGRDPEQVLLERADEPLGAAVSFRSAHEGGELSMPRNAISFWKWGGRPAGTRSTATGSEYQCKKGPPDDVKRIFVDASKHVFTIHAVDDAERPVLRRDLARRERRPTRAVCDAHCPERSILKRFG